ncbi:rab11 family-interacting protein 4-like [Ambystoma mexicanum]|uniref:rab11 family-interacting protein 4-like n=1 Tax=Ambystoma mexicanum TaxID=8296 RepID=UPI0037E8AD6F
MGPTRKAEIAPSGKRSPEGDGQEAETTAADFEEKFANEGPDKGITNPLESTHLNGSFLAVWPETFDLPTIPEDQFEDFGEADSPSFKRSSPRALGSWRSTCDLSGLDDDGSCASCSESSEKVSFLEDRLMEMEDDKLKQGETARRQKNINKRLVKRINSLEEQLQIEKIASDDAVRKLRCLHEAALQKVERMREVQVESLNTSVRTLQEENSRMTRKLSALSALNRSLEKKVHCLEDDVSDLQDSLQRLQEHALKLEETVTRERRARETEKEAMSQVIEGLKNELPDLWGEVEEAPSRLPKPPQEDFPREKQQGNLSNAMENMVQENLRLRVEIEELQEALAAQTQALLWQQSGDPRPPAPGSDFCSLVDEMELASQEQVRALEEQKDLNRHLRQYLDRVILTILEKDPTLLEVKKDV